MRATRPAALGLAPQGTQYSIRTCWPLAIPLIKHGPSALRRRTSRIPLGALKRCTYGYSICLCRHAAIAGTCGSDERIDRPVTYDPFGPLDGERGELFDDVAGREQ